MMSTGPTTLHVVREDGSEVWKASAPDNSVPIAPLGNGVLVSADNQLFDITPQGRSVNVGTLSTFSVRQAVVGEPGGQHWAFSTAVHDDGSLVIEDGSGAERTTLTPAHPGVAVVPMVWTANKLVAAAQPLDTAALPVHLFDHAFGPSDIIDLPSGQVSALTGADCDLQTYTQDGYVACVAQPAQPSTSKATSIHLTSPDHHTVAISLASAEAEVGDMRLSPDHHTLALATSPHQQQSGFDVVHLWTVDVTTGHQSPVQEDGFQPVDWLPDGHLVVVRTGGRIGGSPAVAVVLADHAVTVGDGMSHPLVISETSPPAPQAVPALPAPPPAGNLTLPAGDYPLHFATITLGDGNPAPPPNAKSFSAVTVGVSDGSEVIFDSVAVMPSTADATAVLDNLRSVATNLGAVDTQPPAVGTNSISAVETVSVGGRPAQLVEIDFVRGPIVASVAYRSPQGEVTAPTLLGLATKQDQLLESVIPTFVS